MCWIFGCVGARYASTIYSTCRIHYLQLGWHLISTLVLVLFRLLGRSVHRLFVRLVRIVHVVSVMVATSTLVLVLFRLFGRFVHRLFVRLVRIVTLVRAESSVRVALSTLVLVLFQLLGLLVHCT